MIKYIRALFYALSLTLMAFGLTACDNVPSGYVGVKVQKYGDDRGVQLEDYYEKPFNPDGITEGSYKGISQVDPYWMMPMLTAEVSCICN
jgi:hypothetical protein